MLDLEQMTRGKDLRRRHVVDQRLGVLLAFQMIQETSEALDPAFAGQTFELFLNPGFEILLAKVFRQRLETFFDRFGQIFRQILSQDFGQIFAKLRLSTFFVRVSLKVKNVDDGKLFKLGVRRLHFRKESFLILDISE